MNRDQFEISIRSNITSGWPTKYTDPTIDGWSPENNNCFVSRFMTYEIKIIVKIYRDFFEDNLAKFPYLCNDTSAPDDRKIKDFMIAVQDQEMRYFFDKDNNMCVVKLGIG
jgi:hypothetical protein